MAITGTIIKLDNGNLAIDCRSPHYAEPQTIRHVWEMSSYSVRGVCGRDPMSSIGKPATIDYGRVHCYLGDGAHLQGEMAQGGQTPALIVETIDFPCPKVRSGIETRYRDGKWEKYLKSQGWTAA